MSRPFCCNKSSKPYQWSNSNSWMQGFKCKICNRQWIPFFPANWFDGWDKDFDSIREAGIEFDKSFT